MAELERILIGGPIHWCKTYSIRPWVKGMRAMRDYASSILGGATIELYASDNSPDSEFAEMLALTYPDVRVEHVRDPNDPKLPIYARIAASENQQRTAVLDGAYDYMLSVECDVVPGPTALIDLLFKLEADGLDAVQGFYYDGFDEKKFEESPFWLLGLSLIHRRVLEAVPFRFELQRPNGPPDAFFGHDMTARGFKYGFDPRARAQHLRRGGGSSGWELIPDDLAKHRAHTAEILGES